MDAAGRRLDKFGEVLPGEDERVAKAAQSVASWIEDTVNDVQGTQYSREERQQLERTFHVASQAMKLSDDPLKLRAIIQTCSMLAPTVAGDDTVENSIVADPFGIMVRFVSQRRRGRTLLMEAAKLGRIQCLQMLLASRANVDAQSKELFTALHYAAFNGNFSVLRTLLQFGADWTVLNQYGEGPAATARQRGHESCYELIMSARNQTPSFIPLATTLPDGWHAVPDGQGNMYYHHAPSGKSQWNRPGITGHDSTAHSQSNGDAPSYSTATSGDNSADAKSKRTLREPQLSPVISDVDGKNTSSGLRSFCDAVVVPEQRRFLKHRETWGHHESPLSDLRCWVGDGNSLIDSRRRPAQIYSHCEAWLANEAYHAEMARLAFLKYSDAQPKSNFTGSAPHQHAWPSGRATIAIDVRAFRVLEHRVTPAAFASRLQAAVRARQQKLRDNTPAQPRLGSAVSKAASGNDPASRSNRQLIYEQTVLVREDSIVTFGSAESHDQYRIQINHEDVSAAHFKLKVDSISRRSSSHVSKLQKSFAVQDSDYMTQISVQDCGSRLGTRLSTDTGGVFSSPSSSKTLVHTLQPKSDFELLYPAQPEESTTPETGQPQSHLSTRNRLIVWLGRCRLELTLRRRLRHLSNDAEMSSEFQLNPKVIDHLESRVRSSEGKHVELIKSKMRLRQQLVGDNTCLVKATRIPNRAEQRRQKFPDHVEPGQVPGFARPTSLISADKPMATKGVDGRDTMAAKMMKAMGWTEGQTLGRDDGSGKGLVAPIILHGNDGSAGLGAAPPKRSIVDGDPAARAKRLRRLKAMERFQAIDESHSRDSQ